MKLETEVFNVVAAFCLVWITFFIMGIMIILARAKSLEPFSDTSATAIMCKQVMEGRPSLCDKVDAANASVAAAQKSTLTGSRDVPVFFQDFDYEMERKGTTFKNDREGYQGREAFGELPSDNATSNVSKDDLLGALKGY